MFFTKTHNSIVQEALLYVLYVVWVMEGDVIEVQMMNSSREMRDCKRGVNESDRNERFLNFRVLFRRLQNSPESYCARFLSQNTELPKCSVLTKIKNFAQRDFEICPGQFWQIVHKSSILRIFFVRTLIRVIFESFSSIFVRRT